MTWAKLDDGFLTHPKILGLPNAEAVVLAVGGILYASKHETDGMVPRRALGTASFGMLDDPAASAAELVDAGLWKPEGDGWLIHDYLDWNPSRDALQARRVTRRERLARYRDKARDASRDATRDGAANPYPDPTRPGPLGPGVGRARAHTREADPWNGARDRDAIDACGLCDDSGFVETDEPGTVAVCRHGRAPTDTSPIGGAS